MKSYGLNAEKYFDKQHGTWVSYWKEANMTALILIAYATKHGSTQEVAETIAVTLREHALEVEVQPASEVRALDRYSAVVLGAPLYMGRWHGDASGFLKRHRTARSALPSRSGAARASS